MKKACLNKQVFIYSGGTDGTPKITIQPFDFKNIYYCCFDLCKRLCTKKSCCKFFFSSVSRLLWPFMRFMLTTDSPDTQAFLMMLVKHGVNLDAKDQSGKTPLQHSIQMQLPNTTQLLVEAGTDTRYLNGDGTDGCIVMNSLKAFLISYK